ncbi:DUF2267 domain-containing protein [Streptomyces roseicoloratus]|uniref:DUF2267 domain-containing protein n=1 Tax=Streptomyces roseicoloratus TaxID=2508722 RepID=A0ABY9RNE9_9ACTN|nr:DUF2267 domain-containing protein [Streptomyces roseicoloratus]WMX43707.1 DUF2267 domain-containing protein [Streptomyces roseicoloratus]
MTLHAETTTASSTTAPAPAATDGSVTSYTGLLERVRYEGAYPTRERADQAVRSVLAALGRQLVGDERVQLAARLPFEAALTLTAQIPAVTPLGGWEFVKDIARSTGGSLATTRWDVGAVLVPVAHLAGPDLTDRIIRQLPSGYALLFGRPELLPARGAGPGERERGDR